MLVEGDGLDGVPLVVDQVGLRRRVLFCGVRPSVGSRSASTSLLVPLNWNPATTRGSLVLSSRAVSATKRFVSPSLPAFVERVVQFGVRRQLRERFRQERLHVRLRPDFVKVGGLPIRAGLVQVGHRQQHQRVRRQVGHRRSRTAAVRGLLDEINRGSAHPKVSRTKSAGRIFFISRCNRPGRGPPTTQQQCAGLSIRRPFIRPRRFPCADSEGNSQRMELEDYKITKGNLYFISDLSLLLGFVSIMASIAVWFSRKKDDPAGGERSGSLSGCGCPAFSFCPTGSRGRRKNCTASSSLLSGDVANRIRRCRRDHFPARRSQRVAYPRRSWWTLAGSATKSSSRCPAMTGSPAVGAPVKVLTHLQVREDAHILYGFMSVPERDLFRLLVNNVSGIGPKMALAVLSGMSVPNVQKRRRDQRHFLVVEDQRRRQEDGRAHGARTARQTRRRRHVGGGEQFARTHPGRNRHQRCRPGPHFSGLQTGGCAQGGQANPPDPGRPLRRRRILSGWL